MIYIFFFIFSLSLFADEVTLYIMNPLPGSNENIYALPTGQEIHEYSSFNIHELDKFDPTILSNAQKINILGQLNPNENNILPAPPIIQESRIPENVLPSKLATKINFFPFFKNIIYNNRLPIMIICGVCTYGYALWKLFSSSKIDCSFYWSYWKDEIPLEVLYEIPREKVYKELITEINKHYQIHETTITDPFLLFIKDIKYEISIIQRFTHFYEFLKKMWLSNFFPTYKIAYKFAQEKIDRLLYLEELIEDTMHEKYLI